MPRIDITNVEIEGDAVLVTGTVDGVHAQAQVWKSHLDTVGNKGAQRKHLAQALRDQVAAAVRTKPTDLLGTVDL